MDHQILPNATITGDEFVVLPAKLAAAIAGTHPDGRSMPDLLSNLRQWLADHGAQPQPRDDGQPIALSKADRDAFRIGMEAYGYLRVGKGIALAMLDAMEERDALAKFKAFVHARLDRGGVPVDPDPEHNKAHGCRIGGRLDWLFKQASPDIAVLTDAALSVLEERRLQITKRGWTLEHDDDHADGFLALLGGVKALAVTRAGVPTSLIEELRVEIADPRGVFNGNPRQLLVEAAALLLAEIERLDRADAKAGA